MSDLRKLTGPESHSTNGPIRRSERAFARLAPQPIIPTSPVGSPSLPIVDPVRVPDHPSRDAPAPSGASACVSNQLVRTLCTLRCGSYGICSVESGVRGIAEDPYSALRLLLPESPRDRATAELAEAARRIYIADRRGDPLSSAGLPVRPRPHVVACAIDTHSVYP
jgi:hypothetical protein